jgi:hypothetical protein
MGVIALMSILLYGGPLVALVIGVAVAAIRGHPRSAGRRTYAIAAALLALATVALYLYLRANRNLEDLDLVIPFVTMVVTATGTTACLLGVVFYRVAHTGPKIHSDLSGKT